ncbi:MAG: kelch repeat-containing protein [Bryobacteraceae bacterium]
MHKITAIILAGFAILIAAERRGPDWVKATVSAGWQARDSQGEVVFKDRLWILGGWFNSFEAPPRDVWNSADGKTWNRIADDAPWLHSDLPMTIAFKNRIWIMGGWYNGRLPGHSASNAIWSSNDGAKWQRMTPNGAWSSRLAAAIVEFRGRMWIIGGTENYYFGDRRSLKNDVWSSADGRTWTLATANAGWAPRAYHQAVVHDGRIWVFGGGNYVPEYQAMNDVWSSPDGVNWTQVTAAAPWSPRIWFSAVTYRGRMWLLGGWSRVPEQNWGDVWYSADGKDWTRLSAGVTWKERHEHSTFVSKDRIWIAGGHAKPLSNEVWSLRLPRDFFGRN